MCPPWHLDLLPECVRINLLLYLTIKTSPVLEQLGGGMETPAMAPRSPYLCPERRVRADVPAALPRHAADAWHCFQPTNQVCREKYFVYGGWNLLTSREGI